MKLLIKCYFIHFALANILLVIFWILLMQGSCCFIEEKNHSVKCCLSKKIPFSGLLQCSMSFWRKTQWVAAWWVPFGCVCRHKCDDIFRSQHLAGIPLRIEASDKVGTQLSLSDTVHCSPGLVNTCPDLSGGLRFLHEFGIAGCRQRKCFVDTPQQYIIHCLPGTLFHLQQSENAIVKQQNCGKSWTGWW